jgi:TonB family protein
MVVLASAVHAQTSNAPEPAQWKRYTVKKGVHANKTRLERTLTTSAGGVVYAVYCYENPEPRQSLADFYSEQTRDYKPELMLERKIELNGVVGTEYKSLDKDRPAIEQFFATDEHLYRFVVNNAGGDQAGAKQFFSSIALGKNPAGIDLAEPTLQTETGEKVYSTKEVDTKARMTKFVPPSYTDEAKKHGVTGVVILKAVISPTGEVTNVEVISGLPYGLTEKAIEAAKSLKFSPAMKNGKHVPMSMQMEYNFNLY